MYFVFRVLFTMMFWVVVARWSYAEISQSSPALKEVVDHVVEVTTIPTHDKWDLDQMKVIARHLIDSVSANDAFASEKEPK